MGIYSKRDGVLLPIATTRGLKGDPGVQGPQGVPGPQGPAGPAGGGGTGSGANPTDVGYDVLLAAGQSNMWGQFGPLDTTLIDTPDPRVFCWPGSGTYAGQRIIRATEPLPHPPTPNVGNPSGLGPALTFSRWLAASLPSNRRVLIVPRAVGATKITTDWDPDSTSNGNLLNVAIAQVNAALASAGPNSRFVGTIWLQGESDALDNVPGATYATKLDALIAKVRTGVSGGDDTPFVVLGLVPEFVSGTAAAIKAAHAATPTRVLNTAYVPGPVGLALGDNLHYAPDGQRLLGKAAFYAGWLPLVSDADPVYPNAETLQTAVGVQIVDNMDGANGTALTQHAPDSGNGAAWAQSGGTARLTLDGTGQAVVSAANSTFSRYLQDTMVGNDHTVTMDITFNVADGSNASSGVLVRTTGNGGNMLYFGPVSGNTFGIVRFDGSFSVPAQRGFTFTSGQPLRLVFSAIGTALTAKIQRLSDGQWYGETGWTPTESVFCSATIDTVFPGSPGMALAEGASNGATVTRFTALSA